MANQNIQLKDQSGNQLFPRTKWKNIVDAPKMLPSPGTLTINGQDYDGTTDIEITVSGDSSFKLNVVENLPTPTAELRGQLLLLHDKNTNSDKVMLCSLSNGELLWQSIFS